uniref:Ras-GEF domain-containing protein n=2 Tax=Caenorhabditis japonica TaxID=281687 RepID=A0A8R1HR26_CAEJA
MFFSGFFVAISSTRPSQQLTLAVPSCGAKPFFLQKTHAPEDEMNFVLLLIALYLLATLTVAFPFLMISVYIALFIYYNYVTPEIHQEVMNFVEKSYEVVRQTCAPARSAEDDTMTRSGIERARRQYMDHCNGTNRTSSDEERDAKLLLTYQVPILTRYYESIIQFFKRERTDGGPGALKRKAERDEKCTGKKQKSARGVERRKEANCCTARRSIISLLRLIDKKCFLNQEVDIDQIKFSLREVGKLCTKYPKSSQHHTVPSQVKRNAEFCEIETVPNPDEENIDNLLNQLNLKKVPSFSPAFPEIKDDSDDENGVTTKQKEEERAEQHGQKVCEEEVVKLPDGREIRMKKTKTVNVKQTTKHVTISTKSANMPEVSRTFINARRGFDEDEEEENTNFGSPRGDPFERFRSMLKDKEKETEAIEESPAAEPDTPGSSSKSKTIERTKHEASKLDKSNLFAKQIDTYQGKTLIDRKGEGSYEESTHIRSALPQESQVATPPRMHVVEYMKMFGDDKKNNENEYLKGTTISSYVRLNSNLTTHEEQFKKKIQFEFSTAGTSSTTIDLDNLFDLLNQTDFNSLRPPTKFLEDTPVISEPPKAIDWQRESAPYGKDLLIEHDASEYVIFREKGGNVLEVRGGPKDALIVYATQSTHSSLLYQEAFLITFRTFISALELVNKLIKRYLYMSLADDSQSESIARHTFSVIVRIIDDVTHYELDFDLVTSVTSFVYRLIHDGNFTYSRILRTRLLDRIKDSFDIQTVLGTNLCKPKKPYDLFNFKSAELACQLTYIDAQLYHRIESAELLWWAQEQNEQKSKNLVNFTEQFNNLSFWVRTLIITQSTQKERERYMMKFVKIMKNLREMCNFNSYLAILSAIMSTPLARLEWSKNIKDALKEHTAVMDTAQSYKNYRALLQTAKPPCVPYIGIILQDLTFVHAGNPDAIPSDRCHGAKNMINFLKRWNQFAILDSIRKLKKWNYDIKKNDIVIQFFNGFKDRVDEERTWQLSHQIKPSNRKSKAQ